MEIHILKFLIIILILLLINLHVIFVIHAQKIQLQPFYLSFSENMFSHGFPPLDRGGLYPSHGGILDPLSQSLPPPSPHHNHLQPSPFLSSHHHRAVAGSSHVSPTPTIAKPSESSSKDRNISNSKREESRSEVSQDRSNPSILSSLGSLSDRLRSPSSEPHRHRDGNIAPQIPLGKREMEDSLIRRSSAQFNVSQTSTNTTSSSQTLSTIYKSYDNQEETSVLSVSTSSSISVSSSKTRDHFSTDTVSSRLVHSSSLVKASASLSSGKEINQYSF